MALSFDGINDYASVSLDLSAYSSIAVVGYINAAAFTGTEIWLEFTSNYNSSTGGFIVHTDAGAGRLVTSLEGDIGYSREDLNGANLPSAGQWVQYVFSLDKAASTNEATVYFDGTDPTTSRTSNDNNTNAFANDTLYIAARAGSSFFADIDLAELAIYGVAMDEADSSQLQVAAPMLVRPANLIHYWPMIDTSGIDVVGGATLSITGATQTDHPGMARPSAQILHFPPAAVGGGGGGSFKGLTLLGVG